MQADQCGLKVIIIADSLQSKAPSLRKLNEANMRYILSVKPGDHKYLFEFTKIICEQFEERTRDGKIHQYRYVNNVPINESNLDIEVNFLDYVEIDAKGKKQRFTWITNFIITKNNAYEITKGGRCRWKIENETFNTLKNQDYHFEHNFGHGNKYLSTVFAMLMMFAFLIDQVQQLCDASFQKALLKEKRKMYLWENLRGLFFNYMISSWEDVWNAIAFGHKKSGLLPLNST